MLTAALVIAGWIVVYVVVRMMMARSSVRLREDFRQQIDLLATRVERSETSAVQPSVPAAGTGRESVNVLAAAGAAFATRKIIVRPANRQQVHAGGDPWAQQGRAGVWSSHDIAQRWR